MKLRSGAVLEPLARDYTRLQVLFLSMKNRKFEHQQPGLSPMAIGPTSTGKQVVQKFEMWAHMLSNRKGEASSATPQKVKSTESTANSEQTSQSQ